MANDELVEVDCEFVTDTDEAVLIRTYVGSAKGSLSTWVPKSQIDDYSGFNEYEDLHRDDQMSVSIPVWLAEEKGLV